jgi:hypothetical protein
LIVLQVPAKATKTTSTSLCSDQRKHIAHRRLYSQLLQRQQLAHGTRNRASQYIVAQEPANIDEKSNDRSDQRKHSATNSQLLKGRQFAHGARNRASQLIAGQEPVKSKNKQQSPLFRPPQTHHPIVVSVPTHRN